MPSTSHPGLGARSPYCWTTCTISWMTEPTASPSISLLSHSEFALISVSDVDATPFIGLRVTFMDAGAEYPGLGSIATIFGYHSESAGANWFWTQSFNSGEARLSMDMWHFPSAV